MWRVDVLASSVFFEGSPKHPNTGHLLLERHHCFQGTRPALKLNPCAGHSNERNFVGLSVTPDGYIACGSENNCVYTYYHTMPAPLCKHSFSAPGQPGQEVGLLRTHSILNLQRVWKSGGQRCTL